MLPNQCRAFFILLLLLFLCSIRSPAQQLKFEHFDIREGLPSTEVYSIFQDKKGYVWAFTEYGIVKHNGNKFIPVCTNIDFMEASVYCVCESSEGIMYFANSRANIYKVEHDSAFLVKGLEKTSEEILSHSEGMLEIFVDSSSVMYFSTLHHSYRFFPGKNKVEDLSLKYKTDSISLFYKKVNDQFVVIKSSDHSAKKSRVRLLDDNDRILATIPYEGISGERSLIRHRNGNFYFMGKHSVTLLTADKKIIKKTFAEPTITMETAPNGHVWIGVAGTGLYELDEHLNICGNYFNGLIVSHLLFDEQSGLWVSTIENGVYYCRNIYDLHYYNIRNLNNSISLLKEVNGKLFIGTTNGYLFVKEKDSLRAIDIAEKSWVTDIIYAAPGYFLGTKSRNYLLDEKFNFIKRYGDQGSYGIMELNPDSVIFVTGSAIIRHGLNGEGNIRQQNIPRIRNIIRRSENEYLIGTQKGVYRYTDVAAIPGFLDELRSKSISRMRSAPNGGTWICTKGCGFYLLSADNKLKAYTGIPSEVVNDVIVKNNSQILLSTNKGLFMNYLETIDQKESWLQLLDDEILSTEICKGVVYVATKKGLITLNSPDFLLPGKLRFYLESVTVNNKKMGPGPLKLQYDQNNVDFNFDLLSYPLPGKILSYELRGPLSIKDTLNVTQLHFQNLPPGNYSLQVSAETNFASTNKNSLLITFIIEPAFWQTDLFIFGMAVLVISIIFLIMVYNYSRFKSKQERKSMITRMLVEYRLTALKAQINPHFISNSLTAIQQLMLKDIDRANQYVARFSLLIRYVLRYSDKFVTSLESEIRIIDLDVELEQLRFNNSFTFEKKIGDEVNVSEVYIPPLITQPFIENAIWHGLLPLKEMRVPKLILEIDIKGKDLVISIIDNGVGRQQKATEAAGGERESKGTSLIRTKMENLNQMYSTDGIGMRYTDLKDESGNPRGTQVDLIFPLTVLNKLYNEKDQ